MIKNEFTSIVYHVCYVTRATNVVLFRGYSIVMQAVQYFSLINIFEIGLKKRIEACCVI